MRLSGLAQPCLAKECYGSRISKDELIEVTIGLAEPMREGDTIQCLFYGPMELNDSQIDSKSSKWL
jgi:hypothetical protein